MSDKLTDNLTISNGSPSDWDGYEGLIIWSSQHCVWCELEHLKALLRSSFSKGSYLLSTD